MIWVWRGRRMLSDVGPGGLFGSGNVLGGQPSTLPIPRSPIPP